MAFDVLVIGSGIEANRELVGPKQVCGSTEQAGEILREVLTDPDLRHELLADQAARGRRFAASRMVGDWLRIYERLAAQQPDATRGAGLTGGDGLTT